MKINFLGDSITEGAGITSLEKRYDIVVKNALQCETNNYGKSGSRFAEQQEKKPEWDWDDLSFQTRMVNMDKTADLVFIFGGTNDYGHGDADFGNVNEEEGESFCAATHKICKYLLKHWKPSQITFIIPLPRYHEWEPCPEGKRKDNPKLESYRLAIRDIVMSYGIMFLDVRDEFPKPIFNTPTEFYIDGLHPNDNGHALLARKIVEYIQDRYIEKNYQVIDL